VVKVRIDRPAEADEPDRADDGADDGADAPRRAADGGAGRDPDRATGRAVSGDGPGQQPDPRADQSLRVERALAHRATVDATNRRDAIDRGCARVEKLERDTVTPAMRRIEAEDPGRCLTGLDHRLKGKDRLAEKVAQSMEKRGRTAEQAFSTVKDAIRYTFEYPEDKYAHGVRADVDRLKAEGFELAELRNSWENEEYKGINSRWRLADNSQLIEVQFHTHASFEGKQETHGAYERLRTLPEDDVEVFALRACQREVTAKIPVPPGAIEIPNYP
jgi:hypothetical protein